MSFQLSLSHNMLDDRIEYSECSFTPQPIQPNLSAETPQFKPALNETRGRRPQCPSLLFQHEDSVDIETFQQSNPPFRFEVDGCEADHDDGHLTHQPFSLDQTFLPRSYSEEIPVLQPSSMNSSKFLESFPGLLENSVANPDLESSPIFENKLGSIHGKLSPLSSPITTFDESQQQQRLQSIDENCTSADGERNIKTSMGLHVETDDEFSLLVAAAASAYFNTLLQKEEDAEQAGLLELPGVPLSQDSSASSDFGILSRLASFKLDPLSPFVQDNSNTEESLHNEKFTTSSCEMSPTPTTAGGNDSTTRTTTSALMHLSASPTDSVLLNFSNPLPSPPSQSNAHFWERSLATHRAFLSPTTTVSGLAGLEQHSALKHQIPNSDGRNRSLGFNNPNNYYCENNNIFRVSSAYRAKIDVCNNNAHNNIYDHRSTGLHSNLNQCGRSQPKDKPNHHNSNQQRLLLEDHNPTRPFASSLHPSSFLFARGVGGRHFCPPIVLAHPEEFRNPSSFLKVYGDPLCGLEGKNNNNGDPSNNGTKAHLAMNGKNGNWVCCQCQNINYPRRFRCNKCNEVRDAVGDAIVNDYTVRVYHHHLKTYKKLGGAAMDTPDAAQRRDAPQQLLRNTQVAPSVVGRSPLRHSKGFIPPFSNQQVRRFNSQPAVGIDSFSLGETYDDLDDDACRGVNPHDPDDRNRLDYPDFNRHPFSYHSKETAPPEVLHEIFNVLDQDNEFQTPTRTQGTFCRLQYEDEEQRVPVQFKQATLGMRHLETPDKQFDHCRSLIDRSGTAKQYNHEVASRLMHQNEILLPSRTTTDARIVEHRSVNRRSLKFPTFESHRDGSQSIYSDNQQ